MAKLPEHQINRCIALEKNDGNVRYSLLCFCDASARAYAAALYLFQKSSTSESKSDLLFCKKRLAPLKEMAIPRLELMAVVIGVRCLRFVKQQLNISIEGIHLWTDSQCVLKWIGSEKDLSVFVANSVKEIKLMVTLYLVTSHLEKILLILRLVGPPSNTSLKIDCGGLDRSDLRTQKQNGQVQ